MLWAGDPSKYPLLTRQDRHDIVFGAATRKRHRNSEVDGPFEHLHQEGDIWIVTRDAFDPARHVWGWRVAPEAARNAVRKWLERSGNSEGANR